MDIQWTRVIDPDEALKLLPAWFGTRMVKANGRFGLMLVTGDILRCTSIVSVHMSSTGVLFADVLLDHAGVPDGVDEAWRSKHFLGIPVPAATLSTVNLAHVVAAIEFTAAEFAEKPEESTIPANDEVVLPLGETPISDEIRPRVIAAG